MRSNSFDFIQTAPRQTAEFLIFNQRFLFKRESENAERGGRRNGTGRPRGSLAHCRLPQLGRIAQPPPSPEALMSELIGITVRK